MLNEFEKRNCLKFYHAGGDKEGPSKVLKDKIVLSNKSHKDCFICYGDMPKGTHNRVTIVIWDGFMHSRTCEKCCRAMAEAFTTNGDSIYKRYDLGYKRSLKKGNSKP